MDTLTQASPAEVALAREDARLRKLVRDYFQAVDAADLANAELHNLRGKARREQEQRCYHAYSKRRELHLRLLREVGLGADR